MRAGFAIRALVLLVLAAAAAWSAWWVIGSRMQRAAIEDWLAARRADGWVAEAENLGVSGFPNRFDTRIAGLDLADPESGWSWQADSFQILALSYRPNHVIAVWPGEQVVASPHESIAVESVLMRGSVIFAPRPGFVLARSTVEIDDMTLRGESGWTAALDGAVVALRRAAPGTAPDNAYDFHFDAEGLRLPEAWLRPLGREDVLPPAVEGVEIDATLVFDRPWSRASVEAGGPVLERVRLKDTHLAWGPLDLRGSGELSADAEGYAEGRIDLRARDWREMLKVAVDSGLIGDGLGGAVETGLDLLARLQGTGDSLEMPLVFGDGEMRLGPVTIGTAPVLALRP
jgi:hypothetical protein